MYLYYWHWHFLTVDCFWLYRSFSSEPGSSLMEEWLCSKINENEMNEKASLFPRWHVPTQNELSFASELLVVHFQSALDILLSICQTEMHTEAGKITYDLF